MMKINKSKNSLKSKSDITLIALVITIIVLLILAGVSISLVVGNNGVLTQASNAVIENRKSEAREDVAMAFASAEADYWSDWTADSSKNKNNYFTKERLQEYVTGTINSISTPGADESFTVTYTKDGVQYSFNVDKSGNVRTLLGSEHYGDYFDLRTSILGTRTNGTYTSTVTLEGENTTIKADWRIFSEDSTGVWLILADYLPINGSTINTLITGTGTNQIGLVTKTGDDLSSYPYSVWSNTSRSDLITRLTSNWKGLLPSTLQSDTNITAVGALTVSEWQASWNSKYSSNTITITGDETNGYSYKDLTSETGYTTLNTLYFPHKSAQSNCNGYWLASPSASNANYVMDVGYGGDVYDGGCYNYLIRGVRPAVHLASAINIEQDTTTGIWSISD